MNTAPLSSFNTSRPNAFSVDFTPLREILSKYSGWLSANFDYNEYLYQVGWFFFSSFGQDFATSACRTMLVKQNLPLQHIFAIEHEICTYAGCIMDDLMIAYDQYKALYAEQLHSSRCTLLPGDVFVVYLSWEADALDLLQQQIQALSDANLSNRPHTPTRSR